MAERYTALFRLPGDLYATGWPVIVRGGALYWDGQNRRYVAQLKLQSADRRPIKAVKAELQPRNRADEPLGKGVEHLFAGPWGGRDRCFGEGEAIVLTEQLTGEIPSGLRPASFSVTVKEVLFQNGELWRGEGEPSPLPPAQRLRDALSGTELARQFRLRYGSRAAFVPEKTADLWRCSCGAINREDEATCHRCGASMAEQLSADLTVLAEQRDDRLEVQRQQREAAEHRRALAETEKNARNSVILSAVLRAAVLLAVLVGLALALTRFGSPMYKYREAEKQIARGDYETAAESFAALGDYRDSAQRAEQALLDAPRYTEAMKLLEQKKYTLAYGILKNIGRSDTVADSLMERAQEALDAGDEAGARELLGMTDDPRAGKMLDKLDKGNAQTAGQPETASAGAGAGTITATELQPGDRVTFGSYEQDGNTANGPEPITWVVLKKENGYVELMSLDALAARPYDTRDTVPTWANCSLREWLNGEFLEGAFTEEQRQGMAAIYNEGLNITDMVCILAAKGIRDLPDTDLHYCKPSDEAIREGCKAENGACSWWLVGYSDSHIACSMNARGRVIYNSGGVKDLAYGVRPVIRITVG